MGLRTDNRGAVTYGHTEELDFQYSKQHSEGTGFTSWSRTQLPSGTCPGNTPNKPRPLLSHPPQFIIHPSLGHSTRQSNQLAASFNKPNTNQMTHGDDVTTRRLQAHCYNDTNSGITSDVTSPSLAPRTLYFPQFQPFYSEKRSTSSSEASVHQNTRRRLPQDPSTKRYRHISPNP